MQKLVFDYTYCCEPDSWHWDFPFEYASKEKFILDVWNNPMILNDLGIYVSPTTIENKMIFEEDYIKNIEEYVLTLDEWFEKNKMQIK